MLQWSTSDRMLLLQEDSCTTASVGGVANREVGGHCWLPASGYYLCACVFACVSLCQQKGGDNVERWPHVVVQFWSCEDVKV